MTSRLLMALSFERAKNYRRQILSSFWVIKSNVKGRADGEQRARDQESRAWQAIAQMLALWLLRRQREK